MGERDSRVSQPKPQVLVAQLGARMHYVVPVILHRAGMLAHFYTDAYTGPGSAWYWPAQVARLLPTSWQPPSLRRLLARRADGLPAAKITAFNRLGLAYAQALRRARSTGERLKIHKEYGRRFEQAVTNRGFAGSNAVYAFQGAAVNILKAAKLQGIKAVFEKFIAPAQIECQLLQVEQENWPAWETYLPATDIVQEKCAREEQEHQAADLILCPSEFVLESMVAVGVPREKLRLVPYGYEPPASLPIRSPWDGKRPLRLLFVGSVTLRKGVQYLALALERLRGLPVETRIVGPLAIQEAGRRRLAAVAQLTGQVPRPEVAQHYQWADLLVFPSLCEGSATVIYEALAYGLPVITTFNAGSVVRDGLEGYLVPIRDPEAIAAKIEHLAQNPDLLAWLSHNARQRAREFGWERYAERLISALMPLINSSQER